MTRFSQLSQDAVNRHLRYFREIQNWILQELNELDGDDERVEIMVESRITHMLSCNGPIVMNWGTDNEKEWLVEFAYECCWYWNPNEEKFEK